MNRFELWDKVARNSRYRLPQPFQLVVTLIVYKMYVSII